MNKILSFITNLYIVHKQPFHSSNLAEIIENFLKRNCLSVKLSYKFIESPVQYVHYNPETNTITIHALKVSPKAILRTVGMNAKIIDLTTYKNACLKSLVTGSIFMNLKEIWRFIGKSVEEISDILMCDNQKFFISTYNINILKNSNTTPINVMEKTSSQSNKTQAPIISDFIDISHSEIFTKFEDNSCKKILFTDFDGILSSEYIRSSNGGISKKINYGNKTAVKLAHKMGYRVICITLSKNLESIQISKDVCKECNFDEFYTVINPKLKLEVIQALEMKYNIPLENCVYIGDDFYDSDIFPKIGRAFAPYISKEILLNKPNMWLYSNQPFLEAVYNIQLNEPI